MPIEVERLAAELQPERTVLLFGAGASLPSGAPSVGTIQKHFEKVFGVSGTVYSLSEQSGIIESRTHDRPRVIAELRKLFTPVRPTGAILNLPLYDWKSIYTTNYDRIVEESYERRSRSIAVYSSNFDFSVRRDPTAIQYFKLHGTIDKDVCDGNQSRIILTQADYDQTAEFRQALWDRFKADLAGAHLVVLGHSLGTET